MRKLLLVTGGAILALSGLATPALADPVNITQDHGCYNANINGGKPLLFNGLCYVGPPPIHLP